MARIAVYAGHGGVDAGAVANGLREKNMTLEISNAVTEILRGHGYTVINNRTTNCNRNIAQDAALAMENNVDAIIEIHMNSNDGIPGSGAEAFVSKQDRGRAVNLAIAILRRLTALGITNRGVMTSVNEYGQDSFGILRLTEMPAVLLECAFINNPKEMEIFDISKVAEAIASGINEVLPIATEDYVKKKGVLPTFSGLVMKIGSEGLAVQQLQHCLNRVSQCHPCIEKIKEDGIFGSKTSAAVAAFQRLTGLRSDGIVEPLTWSVLSLECGKCRKPVDL
ncbi:MAG: N-acetylmuramoyl-L-alanine amidase [Defluviitaleaceae bacterium]|nr:N-acetylmuramoyl-L-alanine amidase [Defluviitaleaceae bacterium]